MKSITIRKVPESVHRYWRVRAAKSGRSLEAELRAVLLSLAVKKRSAQAANPRDGEDELALTPQDVSTAPGEALQKVRNILGSDETKAA